MLVRPEGFVAWATDSRAEPQCRRKLDHTLVRCIRYRWLTFGVILRRTNSMNCDLLI
jgi:hypothetical protein